MTYDERLKQANDIRQRLEDAADDLAAHFEGGIYGSVRVGHKWCGMSGGVPLRRLRMVGLVGCVAALGDTLSLLGNRVVPAWEMARSCLEFFCPCLGIWGLLGGGMGVSASGRFLTFARDF